MDERTRVALREIRKMDSDAIVDWFLSEYDQNESDRGFLFGMIAHVSWSKKSRMKLLEYFFQFLPFANSSPYRIFLSISPVREFIGILERRLGDVADKRTLFYSLVPQLRAASKGEADKKLIDDFLERRMGKFMRFE